MDLCACVSEKLSGAGVRGRLDKRLQGMTVAEEIQPRVTIEVTIQPRVTIEVTISWSETKMPRLGTSFKVRIVRPCACAQVLLYIFVLYFFFRFFLL